MKFYAGIGSRETPYFLSETISNIARKLEDLGWTLRSGGAIGADTYFDCVKRKEIYIPWERFNGLLSNGIEYINVTELDSFNDALTIASRFHPAWRKLNDAGKLLMARNVMQILGHDLRSYSKFVICWTKDGKDSGGTGQAIRIANYNTIPVFNLKKEEDLQRLKKFIGEK